MNRIEPAVRHHCSSGMRLSTPSGRGEFSVKLIDEKGVILLLGAKEAATRISWECLEGVDPYLRGRGWVEIGSVFDARSKSGTLDEYLKKHVYRATASWVAALLETAQVLDIDRSRPAKVRLRPPSPL